MNKKLLIDAVVKYLIGLIIVCALLFIPAGTFNYLYGLLLIDKI